MGKAQSSLCSDEPGPPSFIPRVKWSSDEHGSSSGIPYKTLSFMDWPWGLLLASFLSVFTCRTGMCVTYTLLPVTRLSLAGGNALRLLGWEGSNQERTSTLSHLAMVWLPWRLLQPSAAFSLCPESFLHIFHQHTNGYNSFHLAAKTGPPSPSSHHLISLYFYRRIPQRRCLYTLSPCPTVGSHIFTRDTLKVGCVYGLGKKWSRMALLQ